MIQYLEMNKKYSHYKVGIFIVKYRKLITKWKITH